VADAAAPWTGGLLSGSRLAVCLAVAAAGIALDAVLSGRPAVATAGALREVVIHALGFYGGFTLLAVLDRRDAS
jgi:hypothetical protein